MLSGVGGSSLQEAKERLTPDEVSRWADYIHRRGSLNVGMRLEQGFAMLAVVLRRDIASLMVAVNRAGGGNVRIDDLAGSKATMADFMPHVDSEPEQESDINDVMRILSGGR